MAKLIDLTGATVTVPANWTASSSYGIFNIDMDLDDFGWVNTYLYIGYKLNDNDPFENPITNNNSICVPTTPQGLFSQQSFRIQIRGGVDVTNPNLIQWFLDNNATIEGGVWEEDEPSQPTGPHILYKGNVIATLEDGKETVVKCKD